MEKEERQASLLSTETHPRAPHLPQPSQFLPYSIHTLYVVGWGSLGPLQSHKPASRRLSPPVPHSPESPALSSSSPQLMVMTQQHTRGVGEGNSVLAKAWHADELRPHSWTSQSLGLSPGSANYKPVIRQHLLSWNCWRIDWHYAERQQYRA